MAEDAFIPVQTKYEPAAIVLLCAYIPKNWVLGGPIHCWASSAGGAGRGWGAWAGRADRPGGESIKRRSIYTCFCKETQKKM